MSSLEDQQDWSPSRADLTVIAFLAFVSFLAAVDSTILVTILPVLAQQLNGSAVECFWAGTSFLLTSALSQPLYAALSDPLGPRGLLWSSIFIFGVASAICGLAQNFETLLVGRFIQGVGGGGIIALVQTIFAELVPLSVRPRWFTLILISWALGSVIGPLVGATLAVRISIHWVFWINVPLCGIALIALPFVMKAKQRPRPLLELLLGVDWVGGILFLASTTSVLCGISWGGVEFPWSSGQTVLPITLGALGIVLTVLWEFHAARNPLLPISLLQNASVMLAYLCAFLQGLMLLCVVYYVPLYFASVQRRRPIQTGVCLLPLSCSVMPGAALISYIMARIKQQRLVLYGGWLMATLGAGLLLILRIKTSALTWTVIFLVLGFGSGGLLSAINFSIQTICDPRRGAQAAAMYTFVRSVGMATGVGVGGNVFQNLMAISLRRSGLPDTISRIDNCAGLEERV